MADDDDHARFRELPEPVRPEDMVEVTDTRQLPQPDRDLERDRLLHIAG
jgi:hypothetical protein